MTNLENYTVCKVSSFSTRNFYINTILKNHVYDMTTGISICGSVNMNNDRYDVEQCDEVVECKVCAKAFDKIKTAAAADAASWAAAETETVEKTEQAEHIISELSQAAMTLRYVQATCDNDDKYADVLTAEQCNELDNMFERLQDILKSLGK